MPNAGEDSVRGTPKHVRGSVRIYVAQSGGIVVR